jgi:hypothetical protein
MANNTIINSSTNWIISSEQPSYTQLKEASKELVMAWANDRETKQPVYILELGKHQQGAKCNCECVSCHLPLIAINAAKTEYKRRPHFRHPNGAQKNSCLVLTARFALSQQLLEQNLIELPRRIRSSKVAGLSGTYHEAWVELPPERVRIADSQLLDKTSALLTLEDGRKLLVELTGSLEGDPNEINQLIPTIRLNVSDPSIAGMSREELRKCLTLLWDGACWNNHWEDSRLSEEADVLAKQKAMELLDWLDDIDYSEDKDIDELSLEQKKESLLHKEVKSILEREKKIHLPELKISIERKLPNQEVFIQEHIIQAEMVNLVNVRLEKRLGRVIPDVMAEVITGLSAEDKYQLLIEVTVTNTITSERIERIRQVNLPTIEIDMGRMGGLVSREELTKLVIEETVAKVWLHHPKIAEETIKLNAKFNDELISFEVNKSRKLAILTMPLEECIRNYLTAFQEHSDLVKQSDKIENFAVRLKRALERLEDYTKALSDRGYPEAKKVTFDYEPRRIIQRILSIKTGAVIGYDVDTVWQVINAILLDTDKYQSWHTLYLIAIKQYNPVIPENHLTRVASWRHKVIDTIKTGNNSTYLREPKYDRFLSLLFPELKDALNKDFGKLTSANNDFEQLASTNRGNKKYYDMSKDPLWLKGAELEKWKKDYPDAAKIFFNS